MHAFLHVVSRPTVAKLGWGIVKPADVPEHCCYGPGVDVERAPEDLGMWADRRLVMRASTIDRVGTFAGARILAGDVLTRVTGGFVVTAEERAVGASDLAVELYAQDEISPGTFRVWPKFIDYYVNHSCEPNVVEIAADGTQVAARDISAGEELTIDYLYQVGGRWPDAPCRCGSSRCRNPEAPGVRPRSSASQGQDSSAG
jgi:SET domain